MRGVVTRDIECNVMRIGEKEMKIMNRWIIPMQEDNFHVDVLTILVQEVLEEVRH